MVMQGDTSSIETLLGKSWTNIASQQLPNGRFNNEKGDGFLILNLLQEFLIWCIKLSKIWEQTGGWGAALTFRESVASLMIFSHPLNVATWNNER